jgi:hypothetical protein
MNFFILSLLIHVLLVCDSLGFAEGKSGLDIEFSSEDGSAKFNIVTENAASLSIRLYSLKNTLNKLLKKGTVFVYIVSVFGF